MTHLPGPYRVCPERPQTIQAPDQIGHQDIARMWLDFDNTGERQDTMRLFITSPVLLAVCEGVREDLLIASTGVRELDIDDLIAELNIAINKARGKEAS